MVKGLYSNYIENFDNPYSEDESEVEVESEDEIESEGGEINERFQDSINSKPLMNRGVVEGEVDEEVDKEVEEEVYEEFTNQINRKSSIKEGFSEGKKIIYGKHKLLLKSILFGILFYLLSNKQIYKLTSPYFKNLDPSLMHTLIFVGLHYFINVVFN